MTVQKLEMYESLLQQKIINTDASRVNLVLQNRNFQNALSQQNSWIPGLGHSTIRERVGHYSPVIFFLAATPPKCVPVAQPDWQGPGLVGPTRPMRDAWRWRKRKKNLLNNRKIHQKKKRLAYFFGDLRGSFSVKQDISGTEIWKTFNIFGGTNLVIAVTSKCRPVDTHRCLIHTKESNDASHLSIPWQVTCVVCGLWEKHPWTWTAGT